MEKIDLPKYEAPAIAEYVSIGWMQDIIARYISWKVRKKMKKYYERLGREQYLKNNKII